MVIDPCFRYFSCLCVICSSGNMSMYSNSVFLYARSELYDQTILIIVIIIIIFLGIFVAPNPLRLEFMSWGVGSRLNGRYFPEFTN